MKAIGAMLIALALGGCANLQSLACPAGQTSLRTAQLFFGRSIGDTPAVSEAAFRAFVDQEISPRFPDGLTVLDGGGQWRGPENKLIREASKVVMIVLPKGRGATDRIEAVRDAYKAGFHQDSVLLVTETACVSF